MSDVWTIPPGAERHYCENVLRLPDLRFCYAPPDYAPVPTAPPFARNGHVTFGCFNNMAKVGPDVIALWAKLLLALPDTKLLLKWKSFVDTSFRGRIETLFAEQKISADRLIFRGHSDHAEMLAEYGDIDIALDPFPFSGGLTSCEALWMGVPVITLARQSAPSRQTLGFLAQLGLEELAGQDEAAYVRIAVALAEDRDRLAALRSTLRQRMADSPLCDGPRFARNLEAAFVKMWRG
jgi:predicted O-linked N-acetylglucosamine transferase (SPINDLY family)